MLVSRIREGSAHGRFQPFHNGHLEYILAAKERCEYLWIGITKFDTTPSGLNPLGRPRERAENNPLTYYERMRIIRAALEAHRLDPTSFGFIPFPIETPEKLHLFLPETVRCFTTICEDWNREKIRILQRYGYTVDVLWEREKTVSASLIRELIRTGNEEWKALVPEATISILEAIDLQERLHSVTDTRETIE